MRVEGLCLPWGIGSGQMRRGGGARSVGETVQRACACPGGVRGAAGASTPKAGKKCAVVGSFCRPWRPPSGWAHGRSEAMSSFQRAPGGRSPIPVHPLWCRRGTVRAEYKKRTTHIGLDVGMLGGGPEKNCSGSLVAPRYPSYSPPHALQMCQLLRCAAL